MNSVCIGKFCCEHCCSVRRNPCTDFCCLIRWRRFERPDSLKWRWSLGLMYFAPDICWLIPLYFQLTRGLWLRILWDTFMRTSFTAADCSLFSFLSGIPIKNSSLVLSVNKFASSMNWFVMSIGVLSEGLQPLYKSLPPINSKSLQYWLMGKTKLYTSLMVATEMYKIFRFPVRNVFLVNLWSKWTSILTIGKDDIACHIQPMGINTISELRCRGKVLGAHVNWIRVVDARDSFWPGNRSSETDTGWLT